MKREKLPDERKGLTHKFQIGEEHKGYITVGFYDDGRVGEIFVKMNEQGSEVSGFMDAWAISVSMLLQMGMPLAKLCTKFRGMRFEPAGITKNPKIRIALSPIDYITRWLEYRFLDESMEADPEQRDSVPTVEVCQREGCGNTEDLRVHFGERLCKRCSEGRAVPPKPKAEVAS